MKALIVTTHPIQYQAPLFRELAKRVDLTVLFMMRQTPKGQAASGFGVEFCRCSTRFGSHAVRISSKCYLCVKTNY